MASTDRTVKEDDRPDRPVTAAVPSPTPPSLGSSLLGQGRPLEGLAAVPEKTQLSSLGMGYQPPNHTTSSSSRQASRPPSAASSLTAMNPSMLALAAGGQGGGFESSSPKSTQSSPRFASAFTAWPNRRMTSGTVGRATEGEAEDAQEDQAIASSSVQPLAISSRRRRDSQLPLVDPGQEDFDTLENDLPYNPFTPSSSNAIFSGQVNQSIPSSMSAMHHMRSRPELNLMSRSNEESADEWPSAMREEDEEEAGEQVDLPGDFEDGPGDVLEENSERRRKRSRDRLRRRDRKSISRRTRRLERAYSGQSIGSRSAFDPDQERTRSPAVTGSLRPHLGRTASFGSASASSGSTYTDSSDSSGSGNRDIGDFLMHAPGPGAHDPVFGDTRIDFDETPNGTPAMFGEDYDSPLPFSLGAAAMSGKVSKQTIYLAEEDVHVQFTAYQTSPWRVVLYRIACVLSLGIVYLLGRWVPKWWLKWVALEVNMPQAKIIVIENQFGDLLLTPVKRERFGNRLSTVFGSTALPQNEAAKRKPAQSSQTDGLARGHGNGNGKASKISLSSRRESLADPILPYLVYLDYRYIRFVLDPRDGTFNIISGWKDPSWVSTKAITKGIDQATAEERVPIFGQNVIEIEDKGIFNLLTDEILHPFYMFQIVSILLWSIDDYYYYAFCIFVISASSITATLIETRGTVRRMREMSRFTCTVRVSRAGKWQLMDSSALVAGDVFEVSHQDLATFPCDCILLSGDAIVNESMLTGESVPVSKIPIVEQELQNMNISGANISPELARHFLFSGTKIVRVRKSRIARANGQIEDLALALVVRTGFNTTKGALVRSMLFPRPNGFKFYRDSFRFIGFLGIIAGLGFIASSFNFIELGIAWSTILLRALDLVTIVVPPALPATMSIGTSFAISRLRKKDIFCISPNRVNVGGKVNVMCFDKTGTLTEDGLDVLGVRVVDDATKQFAEPVRQCRNLTRSMLADLSDGGRRETSDLDNAMLAALTTCHSLKVVNDQIVGDPLDMKMFEFTGWHLEEANANRGEPEPRSATANFAGHEQPTNVQLYTEVQTIVRSPSIESSGSDSAIEIGILRTFEFVSALRRMSVITRRPDSSETMDVYVKGAPEVMGDICQEKSFPEDYQRRLAEYTHNGYRVIACAHKSLKRVADGNLQKLKRDQIESDLTFLGFIIFENKVKPGTASVIETLRNAHIRQVMCTGDNPLTAISVSRECGLIYDYQHVFVPHFGKGGPRIAESLVRWQSIDNPEYELDSLSLKPTNMRQDGSDDEHYPDGSTRDGMMPNFDFYDYTLAVTGDIFRWMIDYAPLETLQRMLVKGAIYARMSPDEKHELVEKLQMLGYTVGFCGDGANDCGALKAADVGLSLSEAEASVAAPFTSRSPDIGCVLQVIAEGRAALVTSFTCFKYMALYSLIQFTTVTLLYAFASTLGDFQFLYIDLFIILPVAVVMGRTLPYPRIHPKRPTANLVSKKVLSSIVGQIVLTSAFQIFLFFYVRHQSWYEAPTIDVNKLEISNYENTALFILSTFQYISVAAIFSVGPPYRKPLYSNIWFVLVLLALTLFSIFVLFDSNGFFFTLLELVEIPFTFHLQLALLIVLNITAGWLFENYGHRHVARAVGQLGRRYRKMRRGYERKDGKVYKRVEENLREG